MGNDLVQIDTSDLAQRYGFGSWIFQDLDLRVRPGITALLGPNGAGKTTLMRTLAGHLEPAKGQISVGSKNLLGPDRQKVLKEISYLPQTMTFDARASVYDFILYLCYMRGVDLSEIKAEIAQALSRFNISDLAKRPVGKLSGGQLRRVGLAAVLLGNPRYLFLDEPTAGLDPVQRINLREEIGKKLAPLTVLSTHLIEDIVHIADRVIVFDQGKVKFDGCVSELESLATGENPEMSAAEAGFLSVLSGT